MEARDQEEFYLEWRPLGTCQDLGGGGAELDSDVHAVITAGPSWGPSQDGQGDFRVATVYLTTPRHQTRGQ